MAGAPTFGAVGTFLFSSGSTASFAVPTGVAANSVILIPIFLDGSGFSITTMATGFGHVPGSPIANPGGAGAAGAHTLAVVWKRASAADSGTYDFTLSGSTYRAGAACRYENCTTSGTPFDTAGGGDTPTATDTTSGTTSPPVNTTSLGADRLMVHATSNWSGGTWTQPTGYSKRVDGGDHVHILSDLAQAVAGNSGSITASCTGSDKRSAWIGALIGTTAASSTIKPVRPRLWLPTHQRASWW